MRQAKMTLLGLYNWDSSLFDGLQLPQGINKVDFVDELLSQCAWQNILYTDFDLMKRLIRTWSARRVSAWSRMQKALDAEYNPIHNYDRTEHFTDSRILQNTDTTKVSAYDSDDLENRAETNGKQDGTITHDATVSGNIGVTTSQQMIQSELDLRKADLTQIIITEFINRFCLDVYNY